MSNDCNPLKPTASGYGCSPSNGRGPAGPQGPQGEQGPPGENGTGGGEEYSITGDVIYDPTLTPLIWLRPDEDNEFPVTQVLDSGRILTAWRVADAHLYGGELFSIYTDDNWETISANVPIYTESDDPADYDGRAALPSYVTIGGVRTLICAIVLHLEDPVGVHTYTNHYKVSTDDGESWGPLIDLPLIGGYLSTPIVEQSDGSWVCSSYKPDEHTTLDPRECYMHRSIDQGGSWTTQTLAQGFTEVWFLTHLGKLWAQVRKVDAIAVGYGTWSSSDFGQTWDAEPTSISNDVPIRWNTHPHLFFDGDYWVYGVFRGSHTDSSPGGFGIMRSGDMQHWETFSCLPVDVNDSFSDASFYKVGDAVVCTFAGGKDSKPMGVMTLHNAMVTNIYDEVFRPNLPSINPAITRHFTERWSDNASITSGEIGTLKWGEAGSGTIAYTDSKRSIGSRALELTSSLSSNTQQYLISPPSSANGEDRAVMMTFHVSLGSWNDVQLRCGIIGGGTSIHQGSDQYSAVEYSSTDEHWRYINDPTSGGTGTPLNVDLGEANTGAAGSPISIQIAGALYNEKILGGQYDHVRVIVTNFNGSWVTIADVEIYAPGVINNPAILIELVTQAVTKSVEIDLVEFDYANFAALRYAQPI